MYNSVMVFKNNIGIAISIIHNQKLQFALPLFNSILPIIAVYSVFKLFISKSLESSAKTYDGRIEQKTANFNLNLQKIEEAHQSHPWTATMMTLPSSQILPSPQSCNARRVFTPLQDLYLCNELSAMKALLMIIYFSLSLLQSPASGPDRAASHKSPYYIRLRGVPPWQGHDVVSQGKALCQCTHRLFKFRSPSDT